MRASLESLGRCSLSRNPNSRVKSIQQLETRNIQNGSVTPLPLHCTSCFLGMATGSGLWGGPRDSVYWGRGREQQQ